MLDHTLANFAFRARAEDLSVAATGSMDLSATSAGFARGAGSFITDGFQPGMEVVPAGFASNSTPKLITRVEALLLTVEDGATAEASASGRSLTTGLPLLRRYSANVELQRVARRHYIEMDYVPSGSVQWTAPYDGLRREEGLTVFRWFGIQGFDDVAIRKCMDALLALFKPGTTLTAGSEQVRIHGEPGPWAGQVLPRDGWAVCTGTIPWRAEVLNAA